MISTIKILFDISFLYALSSIFLYLTTATYPSAWGVPVFVFLTGSYIAVINRLKNRVKSQIGIKVIQVICCLLPGLLLMSGLTIWQILQFALVWAFFAFSIWTNRLYINRNEFEEHFLFSGKILAVTIFGFIFFFWSFKRTWAALSGSIPYLIIYLLAGVCLMRILREEGKLSSGRNITVMLTLLLGSSALALLHTPQLILGMVKFIYLNFISYLLFGIAIAIGSVFYGIYLLLPRIVNPPKLAESTEQESGNREEIFGDHVVPITPTEIPAWLKVSAVAILAAAAALGIFFIMRRLMGNKGTDQKKSNFIVESETLKKSELARREKRFCPRQSREAIRWYYRKYLKKGISGGGELLPADNSLIVCKKFNYLFPGNESSKLRDLYILARYNLSEDITKADVETASEIWRTLKKM